MLGLLGGWFIPLLIGALVSSALSGGIQAGYYYLVAKPQRKEAEEREKKRITEMEARQKIANLNQLNQKLAMAHGTGLAMHKLVLEKRERNTEARNYGKPEIES